MKKLTFNLLLVATLCLGLTAACNSKAKEPEITQMEAKQDSLKKAEQKVNEDIDKVQQSLKEVDKEFQTK
jgi:peptidoglycan hydrolase CwlO-like protein